jgi:autotransporter-associated beta strand protein
MIDRRHNRIAEDLTRVRALRGVSALALVIGGLAVARPEAAQAQVGPGSAQCPIINGIVTCGGDVSGGIAIPAGGDREGLTVENLTADIVTDTRPGVDFTAGTATTSIRIVDADNALRLTATAPSNVSGADARIGAIQATASNNATFSLLSDIDIFSLTRCSVSNCFSRNDLLAEGIVVRGSHGNFSIENLGDITVDNDELFGPPPGAIVADMFGADLVSIRNAGTLTLTNADGIVVAADNRRIEIVNDGTITGHSVRNGISLRFASGRRYADGFARPDVPQFTDFSYRIVNNGTIRETFGIFVSHDLNLSDFAYAGRQSGEIVNNGTIAGYIWVEQNGDLTVTNNGRLEGETGILIHQLIEGITDPGSPPTSRVVNSAQGVIDLDDPTPDTGAGYSAIMVNGGIIDISNAGLIDVTSRQARGISAGGSSADTFERPVQLITIDNTGQLLVSGLDARAIDLFRFHPVTANRAPDQRTVITNSGTIAAAGDGADAIFLEHLAPASNPELANIGTVDIDLAASSIVRGGSGAGAAIRFIAGERHTVRNAGLITATSGLAIVGGDAPETIDNSGRIEGSVVLAAGADALFNRAAGVVTGAIDLGAAADLLDNSGQITGNVMLGAGDDVMIVRAGGQLTGNLNLGDGNDRVTLAANSFTGDLVMGTVGASIVTIEGPQIFNQFAASNLDDTLILTGASDYAFDIDELRFSQLGLIAKEGLATVTLNHPRTENFSFNNIEVRAGTLLLNGQFALQDARVTGGTLAGATALNDVTVTGGTLSPGNGGPGQLTILANLTLGANSRLLFDLGAPGQVGGADNDLIAVTGNLTLDGLLDINARPDFGSGVYRLINYGGTLTDNGLAIGSAPAADYIVQTSVAGQVNLVVGGFSGLQFWDGGDTAADGVVDGGAGTWNNGSTNWTTPNGTANTTWRETFAIFQGTAGTVTIDAGGVSAQGLQFAVNGYRLEGGPLTLLAPATLRVGDGSAAGAGYTATIASVIQGTGGIDKTDLGTLVLSGANSYSGGTRVGSGVLQVAGDTNLGAAAGGVTLDGGTLRFSAAATSARTFTIGASGGTIDATNALTLSGEIGGTGALTKTGAGTLTLSGDSSAFAGSTDVNGGILNLTGSLGGSLTVQNGGRLLGTGTLGNLTVASGGTLAPGGSIGTLNITGDAIFRAGSFYELEIGSAGGGDRITVGGGATIEGGTVRVVALDPETQYVEGTRYTFLTAAGGLTGTFAALAESSAFLDFTLGYDANSAFLTVSIVRTFPNVAQTFNQTQSSLALAAFGQAPASDSLAVYNQLLLADATTARAAFDSASGEIYPVLLASGLRHGSDRAERLLGRSHELGGEGWGLWGSANGHDDRTKSDGNGARFTQDGMSGELGIDYRGQGNGWAVGIGGGYDERDVSLPGRTSQAETEGWHLGGYARYGNGGAGFSVTVAGAYASGEADVARTITIGTTTRTAMTRVDVNGWALGGEVRYGLTVGQGWAVGPHLRIAHARADLGRFTETGANSLNLSGGTNNDDSRTRYGGGLFARWDGANGSIDASAAWLRGGAAPAEVGLLMAGAPQTSYGVRASRGDGDALAVSLAGQVGLGRGWSLGANLAGAYGSRERSLQGSATLGWRF